MKIKYYLRRLSKMDYRGFFSAINHAHKKSGKSKIVIFVDMIYCSFKYVMGYVEYNEFEYYNLNSQQRSTFLTLSQSYKINKLYNEEAYHDAVMNKGQFVRNFKKFIHRDFLDIREHPFEAFQEFVQRHRRFIVKQVDSSSGVGLAVYNLDETDYDLQSLYQQCLDNQQYLVEEYFIQHEAMNQLNPSSVNTMRIITFLDDQQTVRFMVKVLKVGNGGSFDNFAQGGMYTILSDEGEVIYPFIDPHGELHTVHPQTGQQLIGFKVPCFQDVEAVLREAALVVPQVRYIGWDVAIGPRGPELIEGNTFSGVFQVIPSMAEHKTGVLPLYRRYIPFLNE